MAEAVINQTVPLNNEQNVTIGRILEASVESSFDQITLALDTDALLAAQEVAQNRASPLPNDQWKQEVKNLNFIIFAYLQSLIVSYATGPEHKNDGYILDRPDNELLQKQCNNQIVNQGYYYCFGILGIAIIIAFGCFIILVNMTLEPLVRLIRRLRGNETGTYRQVEWDMTETLQLQRLVYEGQGTGSWKGAPHQIPVTERNDRFGIVHWVGEGDARRVSRGDFPFVHATSSPTKETVVNVQHVSSPNLSE